MLKKLTILLLIIVVIGSVTIPANALESFSRADIPGDTGEIRLSREMYEATKDLTATSLKLKESLSGLTDITCDNKGNLYVLCGDESRLFQVYDDYSKSVEIKVVDQDGQRVSFKGAKGIYCKNDEQLYISDTANARILITDINGKIERILGTPESDLIPENFFYQPTTFSKDEQGYTYILSAGCYYGVLLYSPEEEFLGFYGSNTSNASALDTLSYLWDKLTGTEAKKASSIRKLPYSFVDFDFDSEGYMVTCTGTTNNTHFISLLDNGEGQLRKITHNGANIYFKRNLFGESQSSDAINFLESKLSFQKVQDIVSVAVSEDNYIYALDRTYGLIYIYDSECNLMSAFGGGYGKGEQLGLFADPISLEIYKDKMFIADVENCSITVFEQTEYGKVLCEAQNLYLKGNYEKAEAYWKSVLSSNRNCQLAYRGLAMISYNNGDYDKAIQYSRLAMDYSVYDMAWQQIVTNFIAKHFVVILIAVIVIVVGTVLLIINLKKRNIRLIKSRKLRLALALPIHPFDTLRIIKSEKQCSVLIAIVLTLLFYLSAVLKATSSGFLFTTTLVKNYNSLYTLGSTVGLLLLWSVSNWLVCSMFSGKGTLKEVYVSSAYALIPWIIYSFLKVVFSNFLPYSCSGLLNGIEIAVLIYTIFLIVVAEIEIHEYDFFKVLLTGIAIIFFMILVVFLALMFVILLKQFYSFVVSIYDEIAFR